MNALDPVPESYAHATAIAAILARAQQDELELEDGRASSEPDAD